MRPLRYLAAADVAAAMPPLTERLDLAEQTLRALGGDAELPPKIGVHPRQPGSLAHAMPALLRGQEADGRADLIGLKWITGFPQNPSAGLPTYSALLLLNDPATGIPVAIMDAGTITAARTPAVSGVAIRLFMAGVGTEAAAMGEGPQVALLGAGVQARGHVPVVGHLLPGARLRVTDLDRERAEGLAIEAGSVEGITAAEVAGSVREAVEGADVVISAVSFGPQRQALDQAWLGPQTLFVAVDYDMQAPASLARAALFVVDERNQFLATRSASSFAGYPDPDATLGEVLRDGPNRPAGRILVSHLGVGLADVVFGSAILTHAEQLGLGIILPR
jgi:ornithine cyclodeaminase/alanine dehydrogenase-like protein (mu-crystallin family)